MHRWKIGTDSRLLCDECSRQNSPLIIRQGWSWQGEERGVDCLCDSCHCTDKVVKRHGKWRWLYCWINILLPWVSNRRRQAMRRAK
ncbi:MAG: hypothetical protein OEV73_09055 [Desulfobulbaceae bacterium]|nr:hypothetical protein [Desulfobulbaceae bacterium]